jgi:hypothetical protein
MLTECCPTARREITRVAAADPFSVPVPGVVEPYLIFECYCSRRAGKIISDHIPTLPLPSDSGLVTIYESVFHASPTCLRYGTHLKLHPSVRKRSTPIRLQRKCARTDLSCSATTAFELDRIYRCSLLEGVCVERIERLCSPRREGHCPMPGIEEPQTLNPCFRSL